MNRKLLFSAAGVFITFIAVMFWVGSLPSRVTVINRAPRTLRDVVLSAGGRRVEWAELRANETRVVTMPSGEVIMLSFVGEHTRRWSSPQPIAPGQSLVLYITATEKIDARSRLGEYTR